MAEVVLGVDGGQTSTMAAICDHQGRLLGLGRGGPANHVWAPGGIERARRAVADSTAQALLGADLPAKTRFEAAFLGMPGPADPRKLRAVQGAVSTRRFRMENDKVNALASVTAGGPGVVVIAGTGTITYGENAGGESADASGWGYLLGDEGAGYWIARQAVAAACRHWDRRGEPTRLTEKLLAALGIEDLWELYFLVYSEKLSRADFAALAKVVPEAATEGDALAGRILRRAGRELGLSAGTVARRLRMHRGTVTVGMVGGVFQGSSLVRASFRREVRRHAPKAVLRQARLSPVMGSVLLALKLAGVPLTSDVLANLEQALVGGK
jgi:N-acetylglucosamine kinase-like BadF-type ATPase